MKLQLYRNQSTDMQSKLMDWFLYDRDVRDKRVKPYALPHKTRMFPKPRLLQKLWK